MNVSDRLNAYIAAEKILTDARIATQHCDPVWQKVYRIGKYLDGQAAAEFEEVLK